MVRKTFAKSFIWIMLLVMYAPILVLCVFSFTNSRVLGVWSGFSFELYKSLFTNEEIMTALLNTIIVALSSSIVATLLGTVGAIGIFYSNKNVKNTMELANQVPVMNPEIITAVSLTILFVFVGVKFNFITLLIGHVCLTIPFVVLSVIPKLKQMDPNTYEAALDLGANPRQALQKVILPEILPGVLSGFLLSVTLSLDDYIITAFTKKDSFQTLSTLIYEKTKKVVPPTLRALTAVIFVVMLIALVIINFKTKNNFKSNDKLVERNK